MMNPRIVVLREGVDSSQGRGQLLSNINACEAICSILKTTLGPRGMDKLIHSGNGVTISNDGATILKLLDVVHPAAKTLVDIAKSQDDEVGDGTTSVTLLAGEILRYMKPFVEDNVHPTIMISALRSAAVHCLSRMNDIEVKIDKNDIKSTREMLKRCASTALNSKLISGQREFFSEIVVDSILHLYNGNNNTSSNTTVAANNNSQPICDLRLIGIKKVVGGSVTDSKFIEGVAFKKTFAYAGFEQQPKSFSHPKICCLNVELELKSEAQNAEIRISNPSEYQSIVDAEWKIIYNKLDKIVVSGAKIVLSKLPIGDLATQYFADRDIFCAGRVGSDDLERVSLATGAILQTSLSDLNPTVLGICDTFEEKQIGGERYNFFQGCKMARTATILLRGGSDQFIAETERSLHDALMIVKRAISHSSVVGGGGAIEMELSRSLKEYAKTVSTKHQMVLLSYATALEVIPRQLSENAGFDSTVIVNTIRAAHTKDPMGNIWMGVDIENEGMVDTFKSFVWEPALVKKQALAAATEAACMILSVDETIKHPKSEGLNDDRPVPAPRR